MRKVWLVIDESSNKVLALYDDGSVAEKLAPLIAKKFDTTARVEMRRVNMELNMIGTRP